MDTKQFRQTIIGTGVVGAIFGILPVFGELALRSEHGRLPDTSRSLLLIGLDLGSLFVASVGFCIVFFGLLPMAILHGFVWLMRRWTGRD